MKLHGAVPVKSTDKFVEEPAQIAVVPLIAAVGKGLTVINALPVNEVPVQLASETAVKLYVVVKPGDTLIKCGVTVIPVTVTGVVPSV